MRPQVARRTHSATSPTPRQRSRWRRQRACSRACCRACWLSRSALRVRPMHSAASRQGATNRRRHGGGAAGAGCDGAVHQSPGQRRCTPRGCVARRSSTVHPDPRERRGGNPRPADGRRAARAHIYRHRPGAFCNCIHRSWTRSRRVMTTWPRPNCCAT